MGLDVPLEFAHQDGNALRALQERRTCVRYAHSDTEGTSADPSPMSNGIFDLNFVEDGSVVQFHKESVADGSLFGVVVISAELLLLHAEDLGSESIDTRIGSNFVKAERSR